MTQRLARILMVALSLPALGGIARAQELPAFDKKLAAAGKEHVPDALRHLSRRGGQGRRADGRQLHYVPTGPATRLGQRSREGFSFDKVRRTIDGRDPVKGHGGPDADLGRRVQVPRSKPLRAGSRQEDSKLTSPTTSPRSRSVDFSLGPTRGAIPAPAGMNVRASVSRATA